MALTTWAIGPALRLCAAGPACSWEMLHVAGAGTFSRLCFSPGCWGGMSWEGGKATGDLQGRFFLIFLKTFASLGWRNSLWPRGFVLTEGGCCRSAGLVQGHKGRGVNVVGAKGNWSLEEEMSV